MALLSRFAFLISGLCLLLAMGVQLKVSRVFSEPSPAALIHNEHAQFLASLQTATEQAGKRTALACSVLVGPVIGTVTDATARVLFEIDVTASVTLVLHQLRTDKDGFFDSLDEHQQVTHVLSGRSPSIFTFDGLAPSTVYFIAQQNCNPLLATVIVDSSKRELPRSFSYSGRFKTLPARVSLHELPVQLFDENGPFELKNSKVDLFSDKSHRGVEGKEEGEGHVLGVGVISCNNIYVPKFKATQSSQSELNNFSNVVPGDLWLTLLDRVNAGELDALFHLGDQVYADKGVNDKGKADHSLSALQVGLSLLNGTWHTAYPHEAIRLDLLLLQKENVLGKEQQAEKDRLLKMRVLFWEGASTPQEVDKASAAYAVQELFRDVYRMTWSHPPTAAVLSRVQSFMVYDDHDIRDDLGDLHCSLNSTDPRSLSRYLDHQARIVVYQYMRQLRVDVAFDAIADISGDHFLHHFGESSRNNNNSATSSHRGGVISAFFADVRGPKAFWGSHEQSNPHQTYLGPRQWADLKAALCDDGNRCAPAGGLWTGALANTKILLVALPIPVFHTSVPTTDLASKVADDFAGHFMSYEFAHEQIAFLDALREWKERKSGRRIVFLGGDIHMSSHTELLYGGKHVLHQFVSSPIANYPLKNYEIWLYAAICLFDTILGPREYRGTSLLSYIYGSSSFMSVSNTDEQHRYTFHVHRMSNDNNFGMLYVGLSPSQQQHGAEGESSDEAREDGELDPMAVFRLVRGGGIFDKPIYYDRPSVTSTTVG